MTVNELAAMVYENTKEKGFCETDDINQKLLLIVGEICEAQEELRKGKSLHEIYYNYAQDGNAMRKIEKPEGFSVELADAVIRLLSFMAGNGMDVEELIMLKHKYNVTRPPKHGKEF